ncbi:MAG: hypothetical protein KUG80_07285 [Gammaproteobacteria bacterium]|nr:hypothetical protein [Gammaproteobacteria bacterium]
MHFFWWRVKSVERVLQSLLLLALLVSLQGCGVKFVYQQIHWALPWYVDRALDLSSGQEKEFKLRLSVQLRWHQQTQLPLYIKTLDEWEESVLNSHSASAFDRLLARNQVHLVSLVEHLVSDLSPFLLSLSVKQRNTLFELIHGSNQGYASRYLSAETDLEQLRGEDVVDTVRFWFGTVSSAQKKEIVEALSGYVATESIIYSKREQSLSLLQEIMTATISDVQRRERLDDFLSLPWYDVTEMEQKQFDHNAALSISLLEKLLHSATLVQRRHAAAIVGDWAKELSQLL